LTALNDFIAYQIRVFNTMDTQNMSPSDIYISFACALPVDVTLANYYTQVADAIADYLDYAKWDAANAVVDDEVLVKIKSVNTKVDIDLSSDAK